MIKSFTTPCFVETKITDSLIKKVKDLGYQITQNGYGEWFIPKENCHYLYCDNDTYQGEKIYYAMARVMEPSGYKCLNEEEFLAIAALSDKTDKNQWFTDGYHWEKCLDDKANIVAWESKYKTCLHKANPEEIRKKILSQKPNDKIKENMKITKEKKLNENEIIKELEFLKLTDYQKDLLHRRGIPFDCVIYERTKKKGSFLWRLTYPLFFLYIVIILIIIMPINFLITGSSFFKKNGKINKIYELWEDKIFK